MDFAWSQDELALIEVARRVADEVVKPRAAAIDAEAEYPNDVFDAFRETGLLGTAIPERYGGLGLGTSGLVLAVEQVARWCCSSGLILLLTRLPYGPVLYGGSESLREEVGRATAEGRWRGAFCLSEPDAGSDVAAIATRAERTERGYRIRGTKNWISGAALADYFVVAAKTAPELGHRGISVFFVPPGTPGVRVGRKEQKMGVRGVPVNQVHFDGAEVGAECLLGRENEGFPLLMRSLNSVRPVVAARGIGLAEGALTIALEYARARRTFGKPIIEHQGLGWMAAEIATGIEAARLLTYRAAWAVDRSDAGRDVAHLLSMAKLTATDLAVRAATDAIQIMGAPGYMADQPLERYYRDAKQLQIVEGTSQIQKNIIARAVADGLVRY